MEKGQVLTGELVKRMASWMRVGGEGEGAY